MRPDERSQRDPEEDDEAVTALDSTLGAVTRARTVEIALLALVLVAQALLFARPAQRHELRRGGLPRGGRRAAPRPVARFATSSPPSSPGSTTCFAVSRMSRGSAWRIARRAARVTLLGTIGGWLVGRRFGGPVAASRPASADDRAAARPLFGAQVIADHAGARPARCSRWGSRRSGARGGRRRRRGLRGRALGEADRAHRATGRSCGFSAAHCVPRPGRLPRGPRCLLARARHVRSATCGRAASPTTTRRARRRGDPAPAPTDLRPDPARTPFFLLAWLAIVSRSCFAVRGGRCTWPLWTWVLLGVVFLLVHKPLHYNHLIDFPYTLAVATGATLGAALLRSGRVPPCSASLCRAAGFVQQASSRRGADARAAADVAAAAARGASRDRGARCDDRPIISFLARGGSWAARRPRASALRDGSLSDRR